MDNELSIQKANEIASLRDTAKLYRISNNTLEQCLDLQVTSRVTIAKLRKDLEFADDMISNRSIMLKRQEDLLSERQNEISVLNKKLKKAKGSRAFWGASTGIFSGAAILTTILLIVK